MLTGKGSPVDMFSSSSPSLPHGHSSVRSSCGSETAEVLLRSTRVLLSDRSRGSESGPRSVHISVQKLPDSTGVRPKRTEPEPKPKPKKHTHPPGSPEVEPEPDEDVLTSRFTAGGRGVVLGALRRRSNSASNRKEVRVQLLDRREKNPQNDRQAAAGVGVQTEATAPPIGGPSDLETRVSRLLEDIHNLLDSHRRDDSMGRSLSQQTLQHLDALQRQQLQLQGQLLESALKIVTGHTSATSDVTPSVRPQRLQVTTVNGDCSRQHGCSTHGRLPVCTAAADTPPVTMETHHRDCRPQQLNQSRRWSAASERSERFCRGSSRPAGFGRSKPGGGPASPGDAEGDAAAEDGDEDADDTASRTHRTHQARTTNTSRFSLSLKTSPIRTSPIRTSPTTTNPDNVSLTKQHSNKPTPLTTRPSLRRTRPIRTSTINLSNSLISPISNQTSFTPDNLSPTEPHRSRTTPHTTKACSIRRTRPVRPGLSCSRGGPRPRQSWRRRAGSSVRLRGRKRFWRRTWRFC
ncbi:Protein TALPID3 [Oryzias melastigma]|uniref:Protein TALPID3 n=1 Tax=Oryzias melastigma TaxID=30732 RepID=A0A834C7H5_ORYME|nr:Protein TALPID3 [Oryzias melastigma]